jgi:hypothetical protein
MKGHGSHHRRQQSQGLSPTLSPMKAVLCVLDTKAFSSFNPSRNSSVPLKTVVTLLFFVFQQPLTEKGPIRIPLTLSERGVEMLKRTGN